MVTSAAARWGDWFVHEACSAWAGTESDQRLSQALDGATIVLSVTKSSLYGLQLPQGPWRGLQDTQLPPCPLCQAGS